MDFFQCCRSPKRVEEEENRSEEGVGKSKRKVPASSIPVTISIPDCLPALDGSNLLGNSDSKKEDSVEEGDMTQIATLWGNSDSKEEDPVHKLIDYYVHDTKPWVTFDSENEDPVEKGGDKAHTGALSFNLWELAAVTNDFSLESLVGLGNYGRVYKGMPQDGQTNLPSQIVAVKQLDRDGIQGEEELTANFLALGHLNHPNLVDLIGYCTDGDQRLLVYEFMPLGSLEDHLHDLPPNKEPLDWNTRMKIAAGVARGLEYLHNKINPPVIYRFMKSSNILLGEGYHPKLADVGLERFFPTRAKTAYGYCAPEDIVTGNLTVKSDVYSFGVLLLELITGRKAVDNNRCDAEQLLVTWAGLLLSCETKFKFSSMADPLLQGRFPWMSLHEALCLVEQCLYVKEEYRPSIENIVAKVSSLASQTYDPKTGAAQSVVTRHRACKHQCFACSSTPKPTEDDRNTAGVSQDRRGSKFSYNVGSTVGKVNGTSSWKGKGILLH